MFIHVNKKRNERLAQFCRHEFNAKNPETFCNECTNTCIFAQKKCLGNLAIWFFCKTVWIKGVKSNKTASFLQKATLVDFGCSNCWKNIFWYKLKQQKKMKLEIEAFILIRVWKIPEIEIWFYEILEARYRAPTGARQNSFSEKFHTMYRNKRIIMKDSQNPQ